MSEQEDDTVYTVAFSAKWVDKQGRKVEMNLAFLPEDVLGACTTQAHVDRVADWARGAFDKIEELGVCESSD